MTTAIDASQTTTAYRVVIGKRFAHVPTLAEASRLLLLLQYRSMVLGKPSPRKATVVCADTGATYWVSQNGRVWAGTTYVAGSEPVYQPTDVDFEWARTTARASK